MANIWVLVAETSRAKVYEQDFPRSELHELEGFTHTASRLKGTQLVADGPGRTFDSKGDGRHAMVPDSFPKDNEAKDFARMLAQYLEQHRNDNDFKKLVIVAPPGFLGMLREAMPHALKNMVAAEVGKNLVRESARAVQGHLPYSF